MLAARAFVWMLMHSKRICGIMFTEIKQALTKEGFIDEVLLAALNAKYIHSNPALYSLRAYAEKYHPEAAAQVELDRVYESTRRWRKSSPIFMRESRRQWRFLYIWNWKMMQEVISELHQVRPELPIWLGGPEVSYHAEEVLEQFPF